MIINDVMDVLIFALCTCFGGMLGGAAVKTRKGFMAGCLIGVLAGSATIWGGHLAVKSQCKNNSDNQAQNVECQNYSS